MKYSMYVRASEAANTTVKYPILLHSDTLFCKGTLFQNSIQSIFPAKLPMTAKTKK